MGNAGTRKGCAFAWTLLQRLREAVDDLELNTDVGYAEEGDELAGCNREMAISTYGMVANEEIWEFVNPILDRMLGFGRTPEDIRTVLRRGERGVRGLCDFLEYLVEEKGVVGGLLEGKINVLLLAMKE
jgi:hypothetical protein